MWIMHTMITNTTIMSTTIKVAIMWVNNDKSAIIWVRNEMSASKWEQRYERNDHYVTNIHNGGLTPNLPWKMSLSEMSGISWDAIISSLKPPFHFHFKSYYSPTRSSPLWIPTFNSNLKFCSHFFTLIYARKTWKVHLSYEIYVIGSW